MTNKTIAVIMSLYKNDVVEYVRMSVESILNQTYRDLDLYLQYDGPIKPEVDEYLSAIEDVILMGQFLTEREDTILVFFALIDLKSLVRQFCTNPATQVLILCRLVLVEDARNTAVLLGSKVHKSFDGVLSQHTIVDVIDEVADAIKNHQIGLEPLYGSFEQRQALTPLVLTDVEYLVLIFDFVPGRVYS